MKPEILEAYAAYNRDWFYNPHSTNRFSEACRRAVIEAERRLLRAVGVPDAEAEVVWTSGGTEADNLGCLGIMRAASAPVVLASATAHPAVLEPCKRAEDFGGRCVEIPVREDGSLDLDRVPDDVVRRAALAAVLHVNNESGVVHDLERVRTWLLRAGSRARLVVDAAQSCGKLPIPWREARIDVLAVSGRKIGGPPSSGALIVRRGTRLAPILFGGGQQRGLRPGTVDVPSVLAFVDAVEAAVAGRPGEERRMRELREALRDALVVRLGDRVRFITPETGSPWIVLFLLRGVEGAVVMRLLAERGVVVATGSACSAESRKPSRVLTAMGVPPRPARGALRVSFGWGTRREEIDLFVDALVEVLRTF